jgi:hypothetical protein
MGRDPTLYLMWGLPIKEAIEVKVITESVTKYDPDTGEPYEKKITSSKYYLFGRELGSDFEKYPTCYFEEDLGLCVSRTEYNGLANLIKSEFLGVELLDDHFYGCYVTATLSEERVAESKEKAQEKFKSLGYTGPLRLLTLIR